MKYNRFMGEYDDNTIYQAGDVVNFDGASYYRKVPGKGISPIARKKPYTVWSRLNEALSTIFPLGGTGGGSASLPDAAPYQQLVTDGEGKWGTAERLAWKESNEKEIFNQLLSSDGVASPFGLFEVGKRYNVVIDGIKYSDLVAKEDKFEITSIGAPYNADNDSFDFTDEMPFNITTMSTGMDEKPFELYLATELDGEEHNVSIVENNETVRSIPLEYLIGSNILVIVDKDTGTGSCAVPYKTFKEAIINGAGVTCKFTSQNDSFYYRMTYFEVYNDGGARVMFGTGGYVDFDQNGVITHQTGPA